MAAAEAGGDAGDVRVVVEMTRFDHDDKECCTENVTIQQRRHVTTTPHLHTSVLLLHLVIYYYMYLLQYFILSQNCTLCLHSWVSSGRCDCDLWV